MTPLGFGSAGSFYHATLLIDLPGFARMGGAMLPRPTKIFQKAQSLHSRKKPKCGPNGTLSGAGQGGLTPPNDGFGSRTTKLKVSIIGLLSGA
jgi:hypothetical protein